MDGGDGQEGGGCHRWYGRSTVNTSVLFSNVVRVRVLCMYKQQQLYIHRYMYIS